MVLVLTGTLSFDESLLVYRIQVDLKMATGTAGAVLRYFDGGGTQVSPDFTVTDSWVTHELIIEANGSVSQVGFRNSTGSSVVYHMKDFTFTEVTPGCVAANALAVDGWMKESTTDIWREHNGTYTKDGSFYSLKVTAGSANDYLIWTMDGNNTWVVGDPRLHKFDGRTVTMGVWAKTDTASHARIQLQDAGGTNGVNTYSDYHTGGNSWEWLEVTKTFNSDAAERYIYLRAEVDTKTIYYSQPILVFGSSIGEGNYTRPQGEWVYCEKEIPLNNYDGSSYSTASAVINMEAESNGMIPKGCKAVRVTSLTRDSGASGGACSAIYRPYTASMTGQLYNNIGSGALELGDSDIYYNSGQVACDSNGDIHGALTATGSSTLSVWFKPHAVQLR